MDSHSSSKLLPQLIFINGGETFTSEQEYFDWIRSCDWDMRASFPSWKKWIAQWLTGIYDIIATNMPDRTNAKYPAWKAWFEKYFQYLNGEEVTLMGHSLGGIFLAKYLSENPFPSNIKALHLVATVWNHDGTLSPSVGTFTFDPSRLIRLSECAREVHIWYSEDDTVVLPSDALLYHEAIPGSIVHPLVEYGHINTPHFLELFQTLLLQTKS